MVKTESIYIFYNDSILSIVSIEAVKVDVWRVLTSESVIFYREILKEQVRS